MGGTLCPFISFSVDTNGFAEADTASVILAISALPKGVTVASLLAETTIELEIKAGFPTNPDAFSSEDLDTLFIGNVDSFTVDPIEGTLSASARDLTALLIDTKTSEQYRNKTASEVVEAIAGAHGLTAVATSTSARVGTYYQIDHVRQHKARSEWDLLTWLAQEEDFVVYVSGRELHFAPRPDPSQDAYVFELQPAVDDQPREGNFTRISFDKDLNLAKGIKVEVRSWNARRGRPIIKTAGASGADAQHYRYSIPGLTPEQAQARADAIHAELSHHQVKLSLSGPADNILQIDDVIEVRGTDFDQVFYPDTIRRSLGDEGYAWTVEAKNRSRDESANQGVDPEVGTAETLDAATGGAP